LFSDELEDCRAVIRLTVQKATITADDVPEGAEHNVKVEAYGESEDTGFFDGESKDFDPAVFVFKAADGSDGADSFEVQLMRKAEDEDET